MGRPRPTAKRTPELVDKMLKALEMRKAGMEYFEIALTLGYKSHESARWCVAEALKMTLQEPSDHVRNLEAARYNKMLRVASAIAYDQQASSDQRLRALDRMVTISERRAKLLGLDAPVRREITVLTEDAFTAALREVEEEITCLEAKRSAIPSNSTEMLALSPSVSQSESITSQS